MLEAPVASGAEWVALQRHETSVHLAWFGIGLVDILHRDVKDSKELEPGFD
jgi:hypothetical protein